MIRLAIHCASALGLILWLASRASGGMMYLSNSAVEIRNGISAVSYEVAMDELMAQETAAYQATDKLRLSVEPLPDWQLNSAGMKPGDSLIDAAALTSEIDGGYPDFSGDAKPFGQDAFPRNLMESSPTPEQSSWVVRTSTFAAQIGGIVPMLPPYVVNQEVRDAFSWPLRLTDDLVGDCPYEQQLAITSINNDIPTIGDDIASASLTWKDERPNHQSQFPRDAILTVTGGELISRSLKDNAKQYLSGASGNDTKLSLSTRLAQE